MLDEDQHPLERRATALAEGLQRRVQLMAGMMRPSDRAIFHKKLSEPDAIAWWQRNRYTDLGQNVMSTWSPQQVLDLDLKLAQANEAASAA